MAIRKIRDHVLKADKTTDVVYYESSADIIVVKPVEGKITATNVQKALEDLADIAATGGVTSVNGQTGVVQLTKADLELGNVDNTADKDKSVKYADEAGKTTHTLSALGKDNTGAEQTVTFDGSADKEITFKDGDFYTSLSGNALEVSLVDKGYALKTYVDTQDDKKYDKTGGTIDGSVTVTGDLTVKGTTTTIETQNLEVKDNLITVAKDNTATLTSPAGLFVPKYDGTNNVALVVDNDGMAKVGKATLDEAGNISDKSNLQTLATRTGLVDGSLVKYDEANKTLIPVNDGDEIDESIKFTNTNGIFVNRVHTLTDKAILDFDGTNLRLGQTTLPLHLRGSATRPQYTTNGTTFKDVALVEDIVSTKVDNATHADTADTATNATNADNATAADKLSAEKSFALTGAVNGSANSDLSSGVSIATTLGDNTVGTNNIIDGSVSANKLAASGVTEGVYTAVSVSTKGLVTTGAQAYEFGTVVGQVTPSANLVVGGFYLELLAIEE